MTTLAPLPATIDAPIARPRPVGATLRAYVALTKPRIIELLLVTTVPTMVLAARGWPSWWLIVATLAGGALAAGSANTINCYLDRDIDQVMRRTSRRPLASAEGLVRPGEALAFGVALGAVSVAFMGFVVNWPSAMLCLDAILFYVFVYTLWLKRRTPHAVIIGGAAGCFPVLVGWAAVTGSLDWPAWVLFAIMFAWQPPHFWALAMRFRDDYASVSVPMLPVVATPRTVARNTLWWTYLTVAVSLVLVPVGDAGWLYAVAAVGLGGWFLTEAHRLSARVRAGIDAKPMRLFHLSITYLTLLFTAIAVGQFIG